MKIWHLILALAVGIIIGFTARPYVNFGRSDALILQQLTPMPAGSTPSQNHLVGTVTAVTGTKINFTTRVNWNNNLLNVMKTANLDNQTLIYQITAAKGTDSLTGADVKKLADLRDQYQKAMLAKNRGQAQNLQKQLASLMAAGQQDRQAKITDLTKQLSAVAADSRAARSLTVQLAAVRDGLLWQELKPEDLKSGQTIEVWGAGDLKTPQEFTAVQVAVRN